MSGSSCPSRGCFAFTLKRAHYAVVNPSVHRKEDRYRPTSICRADCSKRLRINLRSLANLEVIFTLQGGFLICHCFSDRSQNPKIFWPRMSVVAAAGTPFRGWQCGLDAGNLPLFLNSANTAWTLEQGRGTDWGFMKWLLAKKKCLHATAFCGRNVFCAWSGVPLALWTIYYCYSFRYIYKYIFFCFSLFPVMFGSCTHWFALSLGCGWLRLNGW